MTHRVSFLVALVFLNAIVACPSAIGQSGSEGQGQRQIATAQEKPDSNGFVAPATQRRFIDFIAKYVSRVSLVQIDYSYPATVANVIAAIDRSVEPATAQEDASAYKIRITNAVVDALHESVKNEEARAAWGGLLNEFLFQLQNDSSFDPSKRDHFRQAWEMFAIGIETALQNDKPRRPSDDLATYVSARDAEVAAANEKRAQLDSDLSLWLGISVLVFSAFVMITQLVVMMKRQQPWNQGTFKVFGFALLLNGGIFLTVTGLTKDQMSPMFGLLGAMAGYLLGQNSRRNEFGSEETGMERPDVGAGPLTERTPNAN